MHCRFARWAFRIPHNRLPCVCRSRSKYLGFIHRKSLSLQSSSISRTVVVRSSMSVVPSTSTAIHGSCALEHRHRRRESCPPNHPASKANSECPILTKFSVVPIDPVSDGPAKMIGKHARSPAWLDPGIASRSSHVPLLSLSERPYKFTLASTGVLAHNQ